ncbi:MAG TPA: TonB-dependent receptor [Acidobacteriaceae bacterium]|nr:TonB-dependent receptor [Acidobacteriaceae bacterium]
MTLLLDAKNGRQLAELKTGVSRRIALRALLVLPLCVAVLLSSRAVAQAVSGSINGTITDATGAAVAGASITVTDTDKGTSKVVVSSASGTYLVHDLIPDHYRVKVEAKGFSTAESGVVEVAADNSSELNFQLSVGSSTQTIEVTESAPQLKTDRADVATLLNTLTVEETPNLARNATSLVLLAPATTASTFSNANAEDPQRSIPISANGQSPFSAGFILDGANDKDGFIGEIVVNPPLDSIQEMSFISQNYDAEFGAAVAGVTVMQTKSGSNKFHGSAYEFRRSDAQEARDPFTQYPHNNPVGPDIPNTLSNVFGGTIGGPVLRNKLFFFTDYQGTRQKVGNSFKLTVPTALVHSTCAGGSGNCDLSEYLQGGQGQVYDPATGAVNKDGAATGVGRVPFANNQIPNSRLSAPAVNVLKLLPAPSLPGVQNNYVASGFGVYNFNQFDTRIDDQITSSVHIFGRYGYLGSQQSSPAALGVLGGNGFGVGGWAGSETGGNHSLAVGADVAVKPQLLTDLRFSYFRYAFVEAKYDGTTPLMTSLGMPGLNTGAQGSGGAAQLEIGDASGKIGELSYLGSGNHGANHCNCPLDMTEQEYAFINNWTRDIGHHSVKFGAEIRHLQELRIPSDVNRTGELQFANERTSTASGANPGGLGIASFFLGDVSSFQRYVSSSTNAQEHQYRTFFYVQDNWRLTPKLTLNLGGRWEIYFPEAVNGKGNGGFYDLNTNTIRVAGYGNIGMNLNIQNNFTFLAPRVGFAYQLTPKSVLRAGYGRAFDPGFFGDIFGQLVTQTIPVLENQGLSQLDGNVYDAARNADGSIFNIATGPSAPVQKFPVPASGQFTLPAGIDPTSRPDRMRIPYVDGWNVTFQQQLDPTMSFSLAYVGNKSTHSIPNSTWGGINWNDWTVAGFAEGVSQCKRSVFYAKWGYCGPGYIGYYANEANAHYNSLQATFEKRFSKGFQLNSSYVFSSAVGVANGGYFQIDPHANWGHFDFNRTNDFKVFGNYALPFGRDKQFGANMPAWADAIVNNIALNGTLNWASGLPYTPSYAECGSDRDNGPCRPDLIGSFQQGAGSLNTVTHTVTYYTPVAPLLTNGQVSGAFRRPQVEHFGNLPYNGLWGPGLFTTDLSLSKEFALLESVRLNLQVQAQNAFNHANLSAPSNRCLDCSGAAGAGQITDILGGTFASMRQLQFAAKFSF